MNHDMFVENCVYTSVLCTVETKATHGEHKLFTERPPARPLLQKEFLMCPSVPLENVESCSLKTFREQTQLLNKYKSILLQVISSSTDPRMRNVQTNGISAQR